MIKHTLDEAVIQKRRERCETYRRKTRWLWLLTLIGLVAPIIVLLVSGAKAFPIAFMIFAGGLLAVGVRLSTCTALLYCPNCGHRPLKSYRPSYGATPWLRSPLSARFCEHCYYW